MTFAGSWLPRYSIGLPGVEGAGGFDRAAHRRGDPDWLAEAWAKARVLVVDSGRVLVRSDPPRLVLVDADQAPAGERYFVGVDGDGAPYFAVAGSLEPTDGERPASLRDVGHLLDGCEADLFLTATALVNWHLRHAYSPTTGRPTTVGEGGWTRVTDDGETIFPRTDPAVIVLVHDDAPGPEGRCLLGHNAAWKAPEWERRYSCLAGFVEPGESAEAAVAREVAEEVGVDVSDVRYVGSQPWPFPGSLMLGFMAVGDPGQPVRLHDGEIADARWFTRREVAEVLAGERDDFALPFSVSIAHHLVRTWAAAG